MVAVLLVVVGSLFNNSLPTAPLPQLAERNLPVIDVQTPPVSAEIEAGCTRLIVALPLALDGRPSRPVRSTLPTAYAWGQDPTVLRCGVPRPAGYLVGVGTLAISDVEWFFETTGAGVTYTAVDRGIYLEVFVPSSSDGGATLAILAPIIIATLPYVTPTPG